MVGTGGEHFRVPRFASRYDIIKAFGRGDYFLHVLRVIQRRIDNFCALCDGVMKNLVEIEIQFVLYQNSNSRFVLWHDGSSFGESVLRLFAAAFV